MNKSIIQSFWYGDQLSDIEIVCINSFIDHNYDYHLYSYQQISNLPSGVINKDANEILEHKDFQNCIIYSDKQSSSWLYGAFSDIFRYRLLYLNGGWWHDTDSCCVSDIKLSDEFVFAQHYNSENEILVCSGIIKCPPRSKLLLSCFDTAYKEYKNKDGQIQWGSIGPRLLHNKISEHNLISKICRPIVFCPIKYWETQEYFFSNYIISPETICIHFYTSSWNTEQKTKIKNSPKTLAYNLYNRYLLKNNPKTENFKFDG